MQGHHEAPATVAFVAILKRLHDREFVSPKQFYEVGGQFYSHVDKFIEGFGRVVALTEIKSDALDAINKQLEKGIVDKVKTGLVDFAEEVVTAIHNETNPENMVATLGDLKKPLPTKENIKEYIAMLDRHEKEIDELLNS